MGCGGSSMTAEEKKAIALSKEVEKNIQEGEHEL
jgi:hypothetical protein